MRGPLIFHAPFMSIFINILLVLHVIVSILIIFVTLMQRPKNEGLGAAFGGGMTADLFGAQTSNVLASFTRWLGGIFFGLTLLLSVLYARNSSQPSDIKKKLLSAPRVVATATPAPAKSGSAALAKSGSSAATAEDKKAQEKLVQELQKAISTAAKKGNKADSKENVVNVDKVAQEALKPQKANEAPAPGVAKPGPTAAPAAAAPAPTATPAAAAPAPTATPAPAAPAAPAPTATPAPSTAAPAPTAAAPAATGTNR